MRETGGAGKVDAGEGRGGGGLERSLDLNLNFGRDIGKRAVNFWSG